MSGSTAKCRCKLARLTRWVGVLELVLERLSLALGKRLDEAESLRMVVLADTVVTTGQCNTHVFARNSVDNIIRWCAEQLSDDRELVDVVLSGEKRLALEHLGKDATSTPDVHLDIILLPRQHDLRSAVVSCGNVTGHLRVLDAGKAEIANLQIAVLIDKNVARLQITVNDTRGVDIFQATL